MWEDWLYSSKRIQFINKACVHVLYNTFDSKVENYLADFLKDGWSADMEGWCLPGSNGGISPPLQALDEGKSPLLQ
jgi:hypothetical protein